MSNDWKIKNFGSFHPNVGWFSQNISIFHDILEISWYLPILPPPKKMHLTKIERKLLLPYSSSRNCGESWQMMALVRKPRTRFCKNKRDMSCARTMKQDIKKICQEAPEVKKAKKNAISMITNRSILLYRDYDFFFRNSFITESENNFLICLGF